MLVILFVLLTLHGEDIFIWCFCAIVCTHCEPCWNSMLAKQRTPLNRTAMRKYCASLKISALFQYKSFVMSFTSKHLKCNWMGVCVEIKRRLLFDCYHNAWCTTCKCNMFHLSNFLLAICVVVAAAFFYFIFFLRIAISLMRFTLERFPSNAWCILYGSQRIRQSTVMNYYRHTYDTPFRMAYIQPFHLKLHKTTTN